MNPFQLTGFSFLGFYLVFGIAVIWLLRISFKQLEASDTAVKQNLTDPYLIAHLRAGTKEAVRVATVSLLDRGLLSADGDSLSTTNNKWQKLAQRPIEKSILKFYATASTANAVFKDAGTISACDSYAKTLADQGLLADSNIYAKRLLPVAIALAALLAVCWIKVSIAFSQGRHNVGFLIFLAIVFGVIALVVWRRRLTAQGDAMLTDLRSLFSRLKGRAKTMRAGGQTNEAALLAAVFGLAALPAASFPFLEKLYAARASSRSGCSSSSSCSSGSSCGGGCGGGGCGG